MQHPLEQAYVRLQTMFHAREKSHDAIRKSPKKTAKKRKDDPPIPIPPIQIPSSSPARDERANVIQRMKTLNEQTELLPRLECMLETFYYMLSHPVILQDEAFADTLRDKIPVLREELMVQKNVTIESFKSMTNPLPPTLKSWVQGVMEHQRTLVYVDQITGVFYELEVLMDEARRPVSDTFDWPF